MEKIVNIHEAKTHLSRLIEEVIGGATIIIAKSNLPLVKMVAIANNRKKRSFGGAKGLITFHGDINEPLPYDIIKSFES